MHDRRRGLFLAAAAFTAWGLLSPGNEILLRQVSPAWLQAMRGAIAFTLPAIWWRHRVPAAVRILRTPNLFLALAVGTFLSFALFVYAQTRIPAAYTTLGFYTAPLWTALFGWLWLRERVGWSFLPAVAGLAVGGWLALTGGQGAWPDAIGVALAVGSGLTWGMYAVLLRRHAGGTAWQDLLLASTLLGAVGFLALALITEPWPDVSSFTANTWVWTLIQATIPTLLALGLFQSALRLAPSGEVNILVALELASTVFFAWLLLGFTFAPIELLGVWICLASVAGYLWWRSKPS